MLILGAVGYVANTEQSPETRHTLRLLMSIYPAVFAVLTSVVTGFYPINRKVETELEQAMQDLGQQSAGDES